jgi:hypothetical protein
MAKLYLTKSDIDYLCKKYDLRFGRDYDEHRLFIYSPLFTPYGWDRLFREGYYNSFVELKYHRDVDAYCVLRQAQKPVVFTYKSYYMFDGLDTPSSTKEEFEEWIKETVDYVRIEMPLLHKKKMLQSKLDEIQVDF